MNTNLHWVQGGTGLTNFPSNEKHLYEMAVAFANDETLFLRNEAMDPFPKNHCSLHCTNRFPDKSAFWRIFEKIKAKMLPIPEGWYELTMDDVIKAGDKCSEYIYRHGKILPITSANTWTKCSAIVGDKPNGYQVIRPIPEKQAKLEILDGWFEIPEGALIKEGDKTGMLTRRYFSDSGNCWVDCKHSIGKTVSKNDVVIRKTEIFTRLQVMPGWYELTIDDVIKVGDKCSSYYDWVKDRQHIWQDIQSHMLGKSHDGFRAIRKIQDPLIVNQRNLQERIMELETSVLRLINEKSCLEKTVRQQYEQISNQAKTITAVRNIVK